MKQEGDSLFDAEHIEKVEQQLDQFIEKRAREARDAEKVEELWAESERKVRRERRQANGWAWITYHESLASFHRTRAGEHEDKAAHVRGFLTEHGLLTEHEQKEEPMNEKNDRGGGS